MLTKPDKVLIPAADGHDAVTKADVYDYAGRIAERMLPYIADRPAVLQRFPDGTDGEGWYQKHVPKHFPDWIPTVELPKRGGTVRHVVIDSVEALQYVVNQGTISVHVLGGTVSAPDVPAELLIDLDPSIDDPAQVVEATAVVRASSTTWRLVGFVKTSGSRGIHVHLPLRGDARFDAVRALSNRLAEVLADRHPDLLTVEFAKEDRGDRLFVDVLRNAPDTRVAPYTLRPSPAHRSPCRCAGTRSTRPGRRRARRSRRCSAGSARCRPTRGRATTTPGCRPRSWPIGCSGSSPSRRVTTAPTPASAMPVSS